MTPEGRVNITNEISAVYRARPAVVVAQVRERLAEAAENVQTRFVVNMLTFIALAQTDEERIISTGLWEAIDLTQVDSRSVGKAYVTLSQDMHNIVEENRSTLRGLGKEIFEAIENPTPQESLRAREDDVVALYCYSHHRMPVRAQLLGVTYGVLAIIERMFRREGRMGSHTLEEYEMLHARAQEIFFEHIRNRERSN